LFLVVKAVNSARKKEEAAAEVLPTPAQEVLLTEIRDLLKKNNA
jgi:large conductance mechanosensitive channel